MNLEIAYKILKIEGLNDWVIHLVDYDFECNHEFKIIRTNLYVGTFLHQVAHAKCEPRDFDKEDLTYGHDDVWRDVFNHLVNKYCTFKEGLDKS